MHEAADGVEAIQVLHRAPISCIVTDMIMPRMTGLQLIEEVGRLYPTMNMLLMTAFAGEALMRTPAHVTMMAKPFKPSELLAVVQKLLAPCS